jgi:hypothetical protein
MTTRTNLYVDQGVDFLISLELETEDGNEFPINDQQFFCQVRKMYSSSIAFEAILEPVVNGTTNELNLFINPEDTKNVKPGKYQYDLIMRKFNGNTLKLLEGLLFIIPTITRIKEGNE